MLSKSATTLFFITFCLLIILVSLLLQRSQCFESNLIEKITFSDGSIVDACSTKTQTPFSRKFEKERLSWEKEIFSYENWLYYFWPQPTRKIKIKFYEQPQVPQLRGSELFLWSEHSLNSWILKKTVAEALLSESIEDNLMRSFIADFFVRVWSKNQLVGYGDIGSYFSYHWWRVYEKLSAKNQIQFLNSLARLSKDKSKNLNHYELLNNLRALVEKNEQLFYFKQELKLNQSAQFYDLSADFDFLLMVSQINSSTLEQMDNLQKRFTEFRIGVWDGNILYHVPSQSYLSAKAFRKIHADHYVWEVCKDIEFKVLSNLPAQARKILLVKNCGPQNLNVYASYMSGRTEKFAASHPQAEFILFDVTSLNSQKELFLNELNVFALISNRAQFSEVFSKLGWLGVNFDEKLGVHVPQSSVESIQYFRVKSDSL
jgi:hypothetical protein